MKNRLLTFAGALALLAVLGHVYAKPLLAQVRAALVQNVDEPGRNPIALASGSVTGDDFFFTVPTGKRYVIETFSGVCDTPADFPLTAIGINANGINAFAQPFLYFVPTASTKRWIAHTTTRLYADPGSKITIFTNSSGFQPCFYWVAGYSINVP
jgi:hypothetical protein